MVLWQTYMYRNDENYNTNADFSEWSLPEPKNQPKNGERISYYINTNIGLNWTSNDTSVSETELFEKATYEVDELVKRFYVRFFKANPVSYNFSISFVGIWYSKEFFSKDLDLSTNTKLELSNDNPSIQEQRHRSFGRCYTIYPAENIRSVGIYYYKIDLYVNILAQIFCSRGRPVELLLDVL